MKTILRKTQRRLYFQGPDQWTTDPQKAFNFKTIDRALKFIESWRLDDVEVAFAFRGEEEVTGIPRERMEVGFSKS